MKRKPCDLCGEFDKPGEPVLVHEEHAIHLCCAANRFLALMAEVARKAEELRDRINEDRLRTEKLERELLAMVPTEKSELVH